MVPRQEELRPPPPLREPSNSKASFLSPTPSFEADDENSSEDYQDMDERGGHDPETHTREPRYPGEDTRWTSQKEIWGWLSYGWAAEVFVVCGIGSFLPITLEQLARERGVLLSDHSTPCPTKPLKPLPTLLANTTSNTANAVLSSLAARGTSNPTPKHPNGPCVVTLFGAEINTASFALYTFSISVFVQAIVIISMSGAADHGNYRKRLLLSFAFVGAVATMAFLPIVPAVYVLGAVLAIVANTCFGASFVLLNAFLPVLVRNHPSILDPPRDHSTSSSVFSRETSSRTDREFRSSEEFEDAHRPDLEDSTTALLAPSHENNNTYDRTKPSSTSHQPSTASPELALSTRLSSLGIGIGYTAAVLVQILAVFLLVATSSTTFSFRLVLFVIGTWWLLFTIPAALWLRPRPGPPISTIQQAPSADHDEGYDDREAYNEPHRSPRTWPQSLSQSLASARTSLAQWASYISYAWRSLFRTVARAKQLKDTMLFLAAWFLLSDGIATISGTAVLFAKTELNMDAPALALINVIVTIFGILGAFAWRRISALLRLSPVRTIFACICLLEVIPLYGLLGYVPAIQRYGAGGLQQQWEMYPLGAVYGFVLGGLGAYCRAVFGELIPPGSEAGFYALYAITDKGSSVFGPAVVGAITDRWGGIRPAFVFLAVLVGGAVPLIGAVDVARGRREAALLARKGGYGGGEGERRLNEHDDGEGF